MAMPHPASRLISPQWASTLLLLIVLLGMGASLNGLRLALKVWRMAEQPDAVAASPLPVRFALSGEVFTVPADIVRFPSGSAAEAARSATVETERLDLAMDWGRLPGLDRAPGEPSFHLTLIAGGAPVSDATRIERIYRPFFEGEEIAGPDGLVGHRLAAGSGYGGEILFHESAPEGLGRPADRRFMIRCGSETNSLAPAICFRLVALSANLRLEYRYRRDRLDRWREIDGAVAAFVAEIRQARDG
jgi:hypothetical protein